jgi:MFS transporter, SHS family, sialic acid transporter
MSEPTQLPLHEDIYESRPGYRWLALFAALLAWGFDGVEQGVYGIMTRRALMDLIPEVRPLVKETKDLSDQAAAQANTELAESMHQKVAERTRQIDETVGWYFSLSVAMWLWGAAAGGVIFGRLGDRYGRVHSMLISVTTYAVFTGLSALSTHWSHILAARFLGAMGLGGTWPLCVALLVETWPESRRAVLAGSVGAAANVGFWIAATYSRFMLKHDFTWRWVIGMGFFIGLSSLLIIAFVPEPTKWRISRQKRQRSSLADLFTRQYRRSTIVGSLLSTVALLGTWGSFLWLATYVDQIAARTAYQSTAKAIVSQWASYGQILGGFLGGLLAGWFGNKKSWCFLCVTAWATVFALYGLNTHFTYQMVCMAVLAGIFVTAFFGWIPKFLPELYPTRIRATGQGFSFNIGRVLAGFGVLGAGRLVKLFHGDYRLAMMTMCSIYLVGLLIIQFAPDTGGKMFADEADEGSQTTS